MNLKKAIKSFKEFNIADYILSIAGNLIFVIISLCTFDGLPRLFIKNGYNENPEFARTFVCIGFFVFAIFFIFIRFSINIVDDIFNLIRTLKVKKCGEK